MNKIPKDKRNKLILVAVGAAGVIAALWFFVISAQLASLKDVSKKISDSADNKRKMKRAVDNRTQIEADLKSDTKVIGDLENDMASGDRFAWMVRKIKEFTGSRLVQIPEFSEITKDNKEVECTLIPKFPYRQVSVGIGGSGYYNDFGRFVADFENTYPYMRIVNLQVYPNTPLSPLDREKIAFRMEIVTLTKPGGS